MHKNNCLMIKGSLHYVVRLTRILLNTTIKRFAIKLKAPSIKSELRINHIAKSFAGSLQG